MVDGENELVQVNIGSSMEMITRKQLRLLILSNHLKESMDALRERHSRMSKEVDTKNRADTPKSPNHGGSNK